MPSPVGHLLGGIIAGCSLAAERPRPRQILLFGLLGAAPDLNLLVGLHSRYSHSLGAAVLVGLGAAAIPWAHRRRWSSAGRMSFALACAAAYASHVLLDWLGTDSTHPVGIMALWPFSAAFFQSTRHWFDEISRHPDRPGFWSHNLLAVVREAVRLIPLALLVITIRARFDKRGDRHAGYWLKPRPVLRPRWPAATILRKRGQARYLGSPMPS